MSRHILSEKESIVERQEKIQKEIDSIQKAYEDFSNAVREIVSGFVKALLPEKDM